MAISTNSGISHGLSAANIANALGFSPTSSNPLSVYSSGSAYSLTNSSSLIDFGTTDPTLTINSPGTYLIIARAKINYNSATLAAVRTITLKLRRTNNTAADLSNGSINLLTEVITLLTFTGAYPCWCCIYTTSNSDDIISLFGDISVVPSAGSVDVADASIIAVRLQ